MSNSIIKILLNIKIILSLTRSLTEIQKREKLRIKNYDRCMKNLLTRISLNKKENKQVNKHFDFEIEKFQKCPTSKKLKECLINFIGLTDVIKKDYCKSRNPQYTKKFRKLDG